LASVRPQHALMSTQADPGGQVTLVAQGVAVPPGTDGGQEDPAKERHTRLPSVL